jgi:hypothetical protein
MTLSGYPQCIEELACVRECPELRAPLAAGEFVPDWFAISTSDTSRKAEHVARYRFPNSREAYIFSVRPCRSEGRWYAWGDYCPEGRTVADACYQFLDGGGSFASRSAAEWAIHIYIAHLTAEDTMKANSDLTSAIAAA